MGTSEFDQYFVCMHFCCYVKIFIAFLNITNLEKSANVDGHNLTLHHYSINHITHFPMAFLLLAGLS